MVGVDRDVAAHIYESFEIVLYEFVKRRVRI